MLNMSNMYFFYVSGLDMNRCDGAGVCVPQGAVRSLEPGVPAADFVKDFSDCFAASAPDSRTNVSDPDG